MFMRFGREDVRALEAIVKLGEHFVRVAVAEKRAVGTEGAHQHLAVSIGVGGLDMEFPILNRNTRNGCRYAVGKLGTDDIYM
jgi:hypothetical protein